MYENLLKQYHHTVNNNILNCTLFLDKSFNLRNTKTVFKGPVQYIKNICAEIFTIELNFFFFFLNALDS